jgi:hypothetical protein
MNIISKLLVSLALLAPVVANAQLSSVDGGLGVYDYTNNVTWTSNATLMASQAASYSAGAAAFISTVIADSGGVIHTTPSLLNPSGIYTLSVADFSASTGKMDYFGAQAWVHYLDATNYLGSNQWALPRTVNSPSSCCYPSGAPGLPSQSSSQLAELFYGELGQHLGTDISFTHNANYNLFSNIPDPGILWSGTEAGPGEAWGFYTDEGFQAGTPENYLVDALAVSPGDDDAVAAPEIDPSSAASGVALLVGVLLVLRGRKRSLSA